MTCSNCEDGYHRICAIHSGPDGPFVSDEFNFEECEECHGYGEVEDVGSISDEE